MFPKKYFIAIHDKQHLSGVTEGSWVRESISCLPTHLNKTVARFSNFLSLGSSKEYNLWYVSKFRTGLAKTSTKWIWDDLYGTRNFPSHQVTTVKTSYVLPGSSNMGIFDIFYNPQEAGTRTPCFERLVFGHLFSYFDTESPLAVRLGTFRSLCTFNDHIALCLQENLAFQSSSCQCSKK